MHRGLVPEKYSGIYETEETITFPLWNLSGQMVGYQQYRPAAGKGRYPNPKDMRYFTKIPKGTNTAWGLELLDPHSKYLLVVEGVFDAVNLHNEGFNALALLANNPKPLKSWLQTMNYIIVPICEGDVAGRKLAGIATSDLVEYLPEGVDVGDMTGEEIRERFKQYR